MENWLCLATPIGTQGLLLDLHSEITTSTTLEIIINVEVKARLSVCNQVLYMLYYCSDP